MKHGSVVVLVVILLYFFSIAVPVIAQDESRFSHTIDYKIGGAITIDREIGHECTTGAVKRQTVRGIGEMTKHEDVRIAKNIMSVKEVSDWNIPEEALTGLTVTTTIQLCNRPMSAVSEVYNIDATSKLDVGFIVNTYLPQVLMGIIKVSELTSQLWATEVTTNPGHSGSYHSDFIAAYGPGPYEKLYGAKDIFGNTFFYDDDYMWEYDDTVATYRRDDRAYGYKRGKYYVGNYFNIEQYALTTKGSLKRNISMSSPFENTITIEELSVLGSAAVREAFNMHNLKGGPKGIKLAWYELF